MVGGEFTRMIDLRQIGEAPVRIEADEAERAALAARFALVRLESLSAEVSLRPDGPAVDATGRLKAVWVQSCAVSGDDLPKRLDTALRLRFVPENEPAEDIDIELTDHDSDEVPFTGHSFDLGEAVAQSLALEIDPYATGPGADEARRKAGIIDEAASGPFAALAALKKE